MFVEALFDDEANPHADVEVAKELAGYHKTTPATNILRRVKAKLQDDMQNYFLSKSLIAAKKLVEITTDTNPLPGSEKVLQAATQILDRAGVTKPEKREIEITVPTGVVMLPPIAMYDEEDTSLEEHTSRLLEGSSEELT